METSIQRKSASLPEEHRTKLMDWYREAERLNSAWVSRAKKSFRFATGFDQWDADARATLEDADKPALQFNYLLPTLMVLCGYQRQSRFDYRLYPRRGATIPVARLGTELMKHTMDVCQGAYQMSMAFQDGATCGKGFVQLDVNYDHDPFFGDFEIKRVSPFSILEDQNNNGYLLNDGRFVCARHYPNKEFLKLKYPKMAEEIEAGARYADGGNQYYSDINSLEDYDKGGRMPEMAAVGPDQVEIRDWWYRTNTVRHYLVHLPTLTTAALKDGKYRETKAKVEASPKKDDFKFFDRVSTVLHRAIMLGDECCLEYFENPLKGLVLFPYERFTPYWFDGYVFGVIDNLIDPQEEGNKRYSQTLHHLNQSASSGWEHKTPVNDEAERKLEDYGSTPGVNLNIDDYGGHLKRIEPAQLPQGHFTLSEMAHGKIQYISGINPDLMGARPEHQESGRKAYLRQQAGLTVSETIFDNYRYMAEKFGQILWEGIRTLGVYTEEEIYGVVNEASLRDFILPNGGLDLSLLEDIKNGRYGVKIETTQHLPTARVAQFEELLDIAKLSMEMGNPVDVETIIEASDSPYREKMLEDIRARKQMMQKAMING